MCCGVSGHIQPAHDLASAPIAPASLPLNRVSPFSFSVPCLVHLHHDQAHCPAPTWLRNRKVGTPPLGPSRLPAQEAPKLTASILGSANHSMHHLRAMVSAEWPAVPPAASPALYPQACGWDSPPLLPRPIQQASRMSAHQRAGYASRQPGMQRQLATPPMQLSMPRRLAAELTRSAGVQRSGVRTWAKPQGRGCAAQSHLVGAPRRPR